MVTKWKPVAMGVLAATVGAATFGAIHYMFLAGTAPVGNFFGIPYEVIYPFVLGIAGIIGAQYYWHGKTSTFKDIITYGSAAAIGYGVATYAGWITPVSARARAYAPTAAARAYMPPVISSASNGLVATKMI